MIFNGSETRMRYFSSVRLIGRLTVCGVNLRSEQQSVKHPVIDPLLGDNNRSVDERTQVYKGNGDR